MNREEIRHTKREKEGKKRKIKKRKYPSTEVHEKSLYIVNVCKI